MRRWFLVFVAVVSTLTSAALRIDDTHYRFCVMDDATITDYDAVEADNDNRLPYFTSSAWYGENGVRIDGDKTEIRPQNNVTSVHVLMSKPYDGSNYSLYHSWNIGYNGVAYSQSTQFYIKVQAPSGVSLENISAKVLIGDEFTIKTKLNGLFPSFSGNGYFQYIHSSSDENIATVSAGKITAINPGTATITVKVYARNKKYSGNYYIGKASAEIEVVDNLDPVGISLSEQEISLNVGEESTVSAILTPEDARTTLTWSSSDESVVTVDNGHIKAVGRGNAAVEARTSNGLSAKYYVTVLGDEDYSGVMIDGLYYDLDRTAHTASVMNSAIAEGSPNSKPYPTGNYKGDIVVPQSVKYYGTDYTVTGIGNGAFCGCGVTSVSIPQTVKTIGEWAFAGTPIADITLPDGLQEIGDFAFLSSNIESLVIGPEVRKLGAGVFSYCDNLRAVYISEANPCFVIHNDCIYGTSLETLYYVPSHVDVILFSDRLKTVMAYACGCNRVITTLSLPEGTVEIGDGAFELCDNLKAVVLPNSLQEIGDYAFAACTSLKEVTMGSKLKLVGEYAFGNYAGPQLIRIAALNPPTAVGTSFSNYNATLLVPTGRTTVYKNDSVWGKFAKITDDEDDAGVEDVLADDVHESSHCIYNMQGILISREASDDDIRNLQPGIYVIGGEKVVVR